jgi:hypothetical protein
MTAAEDNGSGGLSKEQRQLRARLAAHTSWANTADRKERTAPARAALLSKFESQVDPDGTMDPQERARRAESARKAHFTRLAYLSAQARKRSRVADAA